MIKSYRKDLHGRNPYFDDFDVDKNFVRVMSRPGLPLQAREITQLQTILQAQVERFGDHFFEEGAVINGGEITEASAIAVRLDATTFTEAELESFLNKNVINSGGVQASVIAYADGSTTLANDNYQILFVNYNTAGSFSSGETLTILGTLPETTVNIITETASTPPAVDVATNIVCVSDGIVYADGFFLQNTPGTIAASGLTGTYRDYTNPSSSIGFKVIRTLVTSDDDDTLSDPSFGFYNFAAPGADRYRVELELTEIPLSDAGTTFDSEDYFELVRIIDGQTTKQVRYTDYAIFEDTLARRTYDESGHYTVAPFQVTTELFSTAYGTDSTSQHAIKVSAGKAYVGGYEFETIAPTYFALDRGLSQQITRQVTLQTPLTNYVNVLRDSSFDSLTTGDDQLRDTFTKNKKAFVQRADDVGVTNIGTCNIRTIEEVDGAIRLYLFNINMFATGDGNGFGNSTHIAVSDSDVTDATQRYRIGTTDTMTAIENVGSGRQIFKAPVGSGLIRAAGADGLNSDFLVRKAYQFEMTGDTATITSTKSFLEGTPRNHSVFYSTSASGTGGTLMNIGTDVAIQVNNSPSTKTLTISIPSGSAIPEDGKGTIIASQRWTSDARNPESNIRTKTLVSGSESDLIGNATTGIVRLNRADVFAIDAITDRFRDVTASFDLDTNAGVDAYRTSRIILKSGATCDIDGNGDLAVSNVSYRYFQHAGDGPFTVDSYPVNDDFTFEDIPEYTDPETGERYSLSDAFDFRPVATSKTEEFFDNGSGGSQVVSYENGVNISTVSYEHYLGRIDALALGINREFRIIPGTPSINPQAPSGDQTDMILGYLNIPPFTESPDDITYRYVDNQRSTMTEINEIEQSAQFDQFFTFRNDLQQEALNRAVNFRSSKNALSDGIFVDTFIGHNNSVTAKRDHNCSIDPESGELRPAFESNYYSLGFTGISLGSNVVVTSDNIYMPESTDTFYAGNVSASNAVNANQFSVYDFLGTMELSPSSDSYFSVSARPKVMVNTVGEVDNWEASINAYQRGRTRGFGSQWRDWETLWFGSRKKNDVSVDHNSGGSEYTTPRRSSFVSRILSDKIIRKIGDKIVDLSVVPYVRPRTITFTAKNLRPSENHTVYFDGVAKVTANSDVSGTASGSFVIPSSTHLTGKKLVRIVNTTSGGDITLAQSSADAMYYAEGMLDTKNGDVYSVRPEITRRKASNSEDVSSDYFDANSKNNVSRSFNSQTPLAQEIFVDPTQFPNGIMLKDIELFFATRPTLVSNKPPVKLHIRPMYNGAPHPYKVLPFSEITKNSDDVTLNNYDDGAGTGTSFQFSTPVYLRPNRSYAICVTANTSDYQVYFGAENEQTLSGPFSEPVVNQDTVNRPRYFGPMHLPLNNGTSYVSKNQYFKMNVNRAVFNTVSGSSSNVTFQTQAVTDKPYHVAFVHANEQITDVVRGSYILRSNDYGGGVVDKAIEFNKTVSDFTSKKILGPSTPARIEANFIADVTQAVATMIDGDRIGILAVEYMANNDDAAAVTEETQPTSRLATNRSRYIGRKVTLSETADDIVVLVDGSFLGNSQIKVYVKLQGPDQPNGVFDDNDWEELYAEGIFSEGASVSGTFAELKPVGENGGIMRFTTNNAAPGTDSDYNSYQVKVVLMGQDVNNEGNASQIPVLNSVSAVPLRSITQDEVRRFIPSGTVLSWAGGSVVPSGFIKCNGASYNYVENPEYLQLFTAIGYTYGGSGDVFAVPDLRGRSIVGAGNGSGLTSRTKGQQSGSETVELTEDEAPLPRHYHGVGRGLNFSFNDDFVFIVSNGIGDTAWNNIGSYESYSVAGANQDGYNGLGSGLEFGTAGGAERGILTTWAIRDSVSTHGGGVNGDVGNVDAHENMQPFTVLDYIIKI